MAPRLHHLTLCVTSVTASATWYQQLLGDASIVERTIPRGRRIRMSWSEGLIIAVTQFDDGDAGVFSHLRVGLDHVGLACDSPDEVREWARKITELGFERGPVEEAHYGWAVTARDPDNIPVEFYFPL